jgi:VWFA-related protein
LQFIVVLTVGLLPVEYALKDEVMTFAKKIIFAFNIVFLLSLSALFVNAQTQQETDAPIKLGSTLVSVPVIVSDRNGRYVAGLRAQDFTLYKDGAKQEIAFFATEEEPLNIALLLDTSRSTESVLDEIKDRAKDFLKQLKAQDRAMIVTFDYDVHVLTRLTSDRKALEQAIKNAAIGEYVGTTLRDAVFEVFDKHFKQVSGRKAIILLTDGKDHGSDVTTDELLEAAEESDTMIYSIFYTTNLPNFRPRDGRPFPRGGPGGFPPMGRRRRFPLMSESSQPFQQFPDRNERRRRREQQNERAEEFLEELSNVSAGRLYRSDIGDLKKNFALIADELRHQYRLGFYPDGERQPGSLHKLRVEVAMQDAVVRSRRSYTD